MADFFKEILTDIDKLSDEQVNQLMAALEVKRAGGQTTKDSIKENDEIPLACPHCGSISLKRHGKAGGRQRYRCKDCCKTFCETSQTLMYHSRLAPAQWKGLLLGMVQNLPLQAIAKTIKKEPGDFFFCHNGITALCSKMDIQNGQLTVKDLNIVNGCQSLSTIFSCGEAAKKSYGYILFKFYEMANSEKADKITNSTNSQSAVKARDLRSNDKIVLSIKKNYEQTYPNGYMVTKRGENVDTTRYDAGHIIQLTDLGKELIAWHSQRPTLSYSETKIFDIYFNQLFKKDYPAEDVQALHELHSAIMSRWNPDNPMGLDETLLAMKSYAPFHHLYAVSIVFAEVSNMSEMVPRPSKVLAQLKECGMMDTIINIAGKTLNRAFKNANSKAVAENRVFSPQNWIKSKASIVSLTEALRVRLDAMEDDETNLGAKVQSCCKLEKQDFESRWTAD